MALIYERMESCGKKVLDTAGVVREAIYQHLTLAVDCQTAISTMH